MFDMQTNDDKGVSPVIGVILMVAITVILAAVIGTFVLDLAGNLEQNAQVSVTFDEDATDKQVSVQINSVQRADAVELRAAGTTAQDRGTPADAWQNISSTDQSADATNLGGSYGGGTTLAIDAAAGNGATLYYDDNGGNDGTPTDSGTITVVGFLDGEGSVLQRYDYGG